MKERYLLINDIVAFGARLEKHIGSDEFLRYPRKTQRMTYLLYSQVRAALEESSVQRAEESFNGIPSNWKKEISNAFKF